MTIKAVLFDIDGTLVDSNDQHIIVWDMIFRGEGHALDRQRIHDQIGKGADGLVPALIPGADAALCKRLGDAHGAAFQAEFLPHIRPFAGADALLRRVSDSGRAVVWATSGSKNEVDRYLALLDAEDLVAAIATSDEVEKTKPAPDIFAAALAKLPDVTPDEAIVVGDTPYDIIAARACGIATVALRSGGFDDRTMSDAGAIRVYDDVAALLDDFADSPLNA